MLFIISLGSTNLSEGKIPESDSEFAFYSTSLSLCRFSTVTKEP